MRRIHTLALASAFVLVSCVDTAGVKPETSKTPHPLTNPNAAVTVIEYGDLQCPACQAAQLGIVQPLLQQFDNQIRFEFRQFPLSTIHRFALEAAQASECAADQGKFWEFIDLAYAKQNELSSEALRDWAEELTLDGDLFDRCIRSKMKRDIVMSEYKEGQSKGVGGTPTFFVNGQIVEMSGDAQAVAKTVQAALDAVKAKL